MLNISKQLRRYFILIASTAVIFITIISNVSMNYFFSNYVMESRGRNDAQLVELIEKLYNNDGGLDGRSLMNIMHYAYSLNTVVRIKTMDNELLWETGTPEEMMNGITGGNSNTRESEKIVYKNHPLNYEGKQIGIIQTGHPERIITTIQDRDFIMTINGVYIAVFIFSVVLAVILSLRVSKNFLKPIYTIKENARLIEEGKYNSLNSINTKTYELHDLSVSIKELAEKLDQQDVLRKRMASDMAHELRTPLATLQSHIEAFMDGIWDPTQERFMIIHDEITRLTNLIKELSDLSKIESEELNLVEKVDLSNVLNDIVDSFEPLFINKKIQVIKDIQPEVFIKGDKSRINQIFINILSNANKYTNENGKVTIELTKSSKQITISVKDTGIGIAKKDINHIFERFYRGDSSRSRETGGSGIGLTITKVLVEAHKGKIQVKSQEGEGTQVIITFNI